VLYICQVIGFARRRPRRTTGAGAIAVALLLLSAVAIGCGAGQGGGESVPKSETAGSPAGAGEQAKAVADSSHPPRTRPRPSRNEGAAKVEKRSDPSPDAGQGGNGRSGDDPRGGGAAESHRQSLGHKGAKACPKQLGRSQCGALVEGFLKAKEDSDPHAIRKPQDCLDVMGRAACEETITAQDAAAESAGSPVNVDECLKTPTPRCKAVLGPIFEQQYAASQEAGD
jgi:hypothetical protein